MRPLIPVLAAALFVPAICPADDAAQKLFQDKCSSCHDHKKAELITTDRAGWEKIVGRMQKRASGAISEKDAAAIVEYLVKTRSGSK